MSDPRMTGLALMAISTSAFVGTNSGSLPPVTFFPALLLFLVGAYRFLRANHEAQKGAARPTRSASREARPEALPKARSPETAPDATGEGAPNPLPDHANTIASAAPATLPPRGNTQSPSGVTRANPPSGATTGGERPSALADQLRKLEQLVEQGILSDEEFAAAKSKLLG